MDLDLDIFESLSFHFIFSFKSLLEMLFVERDAELVHFLLKFLGKLGLLLFFSLFLLLLLHQHLLFLFFFLLLFLFQSKLLCFFNLFFFFSFLFSFFFDFFLLSRFLISNCDDCFLGFCWVLCLGLNWFLGRVGSYSLLNTGYLLRFFFGSFFS